jgi:hypothetical protein
LGESSLWIQDEVFDHGANGHADRGNLHILLGTIIVLINRLLPSDIVVRMCDQMNVKLLVLISSIVILLRFKIPLELVFVFWTSPVSIARHTGK